MFRPYSLGLGGCFTSSSMMRAMASWLDSAGEDLAKDVMAPQCSFTCEPHAARNTPHQHITAYHHVKACRCTFTCEPHATRHTSKMHQSMPMHLHL